MLSKNAASLQLVAFFLHVCNLPSPYRSCLNSHFYRKVENFCEIEKR